MLFRGEYRRNIIGSAPSEARDAQSLEALVREEHDLDAELADLLSAKREVRGSDRPRRPDDS